MNLSTPRSLAVLAAVAAPAMAHAQLTPSGPPEVIVSDGNVAADYLAGPTAVYQNDTLTLTADASLVPGGGFLPTLFQGFQRFESEGPLPVEINPELQADFKLVNTGGQAGDNARQSNVQIRTGLIELDGSTNFFGFPGGPVVYEMTAPLVDVFGNGFEVVDLELDPAPHVLTPGIEYAAYVRVVFLVGEGDAGVGGPTATTFYEGGGISTFPGLRLALNPRVVPEPASAALLALGGVALLRRRR